MVRFLTGLTLAFAMSVAALAQATKVVYIPTGTLTVPATTCVGLNWATENGSGITPPQSGLMWTYAYNQFNGDIATFSDSACSVSTTGGTLAPGADTGTVYIKGLAVGSTSIRTQMTAPGKSLQPAQENVTVTAAPPPGCLTHSTPSNPPSPVFWTAALKFDEEFASAGDLNLTGNTWTSGYKFGNWLPFGSSAITPGSNFQVANGCLTINTDLSGYSAGLLSVGNSSPTVGTFGPVTGTSNNLYIEFAMMVPNPAGWKGGSTAWPAGWSAGVNALKQPQVFPYEEPDVVEFYPRQKCSQGVNPQGPLCLIQTMHNWTATGVGSQNSNNVPTLPSNFNYGAWHVYGILIEPTQIQYFIDNQPMQTVFSTDPSMASLYSQPIFLILGTGQNWPVTFAYVRIWQ